MEKNLPTELAILEVRKRQFNRFPFSIPILAALTAQEDIVDELVLSQQNSNLKNATEQVVYKAKAVQHKPDPHNHQRRKRGIL